MSERGKALTGYEYITSEKVLRISGLPIKMKKIRIISIFPLTNAGIYDILISVIITDFVLKAPMKQNGCKQLYYLFIVSIKHEIKNLF